MIPPETRYALAPDGVHIAYQISGRTAGDALDLVFMQGAVAHLELAWEDSRLSRLFERLGSFSRLIRFDRRAWGCPTSSRGFPASRSRSRTSKR